VSDVGWYPDPDPGAGPGRLRWWDGTRWTDQTTGAATGPPRRDRTRIVVAAACVVALALVVGVVALTRGNGGSPLVPAAEPGTVPASATPRASGSTPPTTSAPAPRPKTTPQPVPGCPAAPLGGGGNLVPGTGAQPHGPRVYDRASRVSYFSPGQPWLPFTMGPWTTKGAAATFNFGYDLIAARNTPLGDYYATLLSGTVPRTSGSGASCLAEEVAADVRIAFYPEGTTRRNLAAKATTVGPYGAYEIDIELGLHAAGFPASERVSVLVINNGRPYLPVLYISIPSSVNSLNYVIAQTFASARAI
jgi:Protein of unknown function (DUF2510)